MSFVAATKSVDGPDNPGHDDPCQATLSPKHGLAPQSGSISPDPPKSAGRSAYFGKPSLTDTILLA